MIRRMSAHLLAPIIAACATGGEAGWQRSARTWMTLDAAFTVAVERRSATIVELANEDLAAAQAAMDGLRRAVARWDVISVGVVTALDLAKRGRQYDDAQLGRALEDAARVVRWLEAHP